MQAMKSQHSRSAGALVGTSPSRLSTYLSGKVTPSASMLLRIETAPTE